MLTTPSASPRMASSGAASARRSRGRNPPVLLAGALLRRPIERVEHRRSGCQTRVILAALEADAGDERGEAARLLAPELRVAQIDVVHHVGDVPQGRVIRPHSGEQDLERAHLAFMRELRVEHVEAELTWRGGVALRLDVLQLGLRIDEA